MDNPIITRTTASHVAHVTIHTHVPVQSQGATAVVAFPSIGLVATIAAHHLIEELDLEQVGVVDSPGFPTISVVEQGNPLNPVRIYAGHAGKRPVVVFLSEFQPSPELVRPVSEALFGWAKDNGCTSIVTPEGLLLEGSAALDDVIEVYGAGSTDEIRQRVSDAGAPLFREGIVAGVTGVLLNLGKRDVYPVAAVLAEAKQGQPDGRSAAKVVQFIGNMLGARIDIRRLHDEADAFDAHVDDVKRRVKLQEGEAPASAGMYG